MLRPRVQVQLHKEAHPLLYRGTFKSTWYPGTRVPVQYSSTVQWSGADERIVTTRAHAISTQLHVAQSARRGRRPPRGAARPGIRTVPPTWPLIPACNCFAKLKRLGIYSLHASSVVSCSTRAQLHCQSATPTEQQSKSCNCSSPLSGSSLRWQLSAPGLSRARACCNLIFISNR